ncbi:DUF2971 domain-containing protein [Pantoea dispersa]|uniref:DUF2971 domain-containing protein n=1 Tax=Pantoea dispersa TaxID=59814 RepID=UPI00092E8DE0|nr:DUF2971 domain-containing protein [Pantoea dispersa]
MILYKYLDLDTAHLIFKNSTLKFSKASSLNDPFELTSLHYGSWQNSEEQIIRRIAASISFGILSLTRNPLNPLMWAHYGRGIQADYKDAMRIDKGNNTHAGIVLGIDPDEAGFNSINSNVIPAKYGSVIYTATKPQHTFENSDNLELYDGMLSRFKPELLEALQRTFLHKASYWAYEEEVRVVRNISRGEYRDEIQPIKKSAFKEVYVGTRNTFNRHYLEGFKEIINNELPSCEIFVCRFNEIDWGLKKLNINDAISNL